MTKSRPGRKGPEENGLEPWGQRDPGQRRVNEAECGILQTHVNAHQRAPPQTPQTSTHPGESAGRAPQRPRDRWRLGLGRQQESH